MALLDHLKELKNRLFKSALAVIAGTVVGFIVYQPLLAALIKPIKDLNNSGGRLAALNFDGVASSFDLMVQVSIFLGVIIASPVWIYQLWAFIAGWRCPSWPLRFPCSLRVCCWPGLSFPTPCAC